MITYRPLAYTSPSGVRIAFDYDGALSDGITHNLGEFKFTGVDGTYYQDRALTVNEFSFLISISDQTALRQIRDVLSEKIQPGITGTLEHPDPTIGNIPVVVSAFSVSQNSVKGKGKIDITVAFLKTIVTLIAGDPSTADTASNIYNNIDDLNESQANDAADAVDTETGSGFAAFVNASTTTVTNARDILGKIAAKTDAINILFTNSVADLLSNIDSLAREPFTLARKIQNLIQLPMLAVDSATDRIAAYQDYVNETLSVTDNENTEIENGSATGKNILTAKTVASLAAISALNYSAVSTSSITVNQIITGEEFTESGYLYRNQIIEAIKALQDTSRLLIETLSALAANYGETSFFKQYFDYSVLSKYLLSISIRNLNNRIFSAALEITIYTEKEAHPIVFCTEIYKSAELNTIQFFCQSNNLHGEELYLIPKGRMMVYYQ